ncbi:MAG: hypothetical protein IPI67_14735 [Myxococcales bacterium]|nr:hypothetical protein [Myxococcales bacterium]
MRKLRKLPILLLSGSLAATSCSSDGDEAAGASGGTAGSGGSANSGGTGGSTGGTSASGGNASGGVAGSAGTSSSGGTSTSDAAPDDSSAGGTGAGGTSPDGGSADADAGSDAGGNPKLGCPTAFGKEVFRDDFDGTAVDTAKWSVVQQNTGGGTFTQLTKMLASNVTVSQGRLRVASHRHCVDPYPNATPEQPAKCAGTNYYSGGWLRATKGYAPGKGLMMFLAKLPPPVRGIFPGLWARNTDSGANYGELDLMETWWDTKTKGVQGDPNVFFVTTWLGSAPANTTGNTAGPFANLTGALHVWEVEWDASANPPNVKYFYRDTLGAARVLLRTVTSATQGLAGKITDTQLSTILALPWRPYVDFAVQPDTTWHVGPDTAPVYDPDDLEVDSVVVCQP